MNKKWTWPYGFKQTIFLLLLFAVFCRQGYAQCIEIKPPNGINRIEQCPNTPVSLSPAIVTAGASGVTYSWAASGGMIFSPANSPTGNTTMPSSVQTASLTVTGNVELITNGNFESGTTGWSTQYGIGCFGPGSVYVAFISNACGHGDCPASFDHTLNSPSGHMLEVDGTTNASLRRFWSETIHGCGSSGPYNFSCFFKSIARNRDKLVPIRKDERPHVKIFTSSLGMVYDCGYIQGCGPWIPISFSIPSVAATDLIWMEDVNTGATMGNEFVVDDISLTHTDSKTFVYTLAPYPAPDPLATISISPSPVCCGTPFSLSINPTTGCGTGCTYTWNFLTPAGMPATGSPVTHAAIPCSATITPNAVVTMQNSYGCTTSANRPIIVTRPANAGVINGTHDLCQGKVYYFTTTGDPGGIWSQTPPIMAPVTVGLFNGVVTASTTGTGPATIKYTVLSGCGPASIATYPVTVHPNPVGGVAFTGPYIMCPGSVTITLTGTPGATIYYSYMLPSGLGSSIMHVVVNAMGTAPLTFSLSEGLFHLWVSHVDNGFCTTDIKIPVDITVKQPTASIISQPKPCVGQPFTFAVQGPSGPTALTSGVVRIDPVAPTTGGPWYVPIPPSASLTNIGYVTITPPLGDPGPYLYQVTGGTGYGCPFTIPTPITVTVTPIPYPAITSTSNSPLCAGDALTLTATCTSGCAPTANITGPFGFSATAPLIGTTYTASIPSTSILNSGTYVWSVSNAYCPTTSSTNVSVRPRPFASMTIDQTCAADVSTLLHFTGSSHAIVSYTAGGYPQPPVTLGSSGTYTISVPSMWGVPYVITDVYNSFSGCHSITSWPPVYNVAPLMPNSYPVYIGGTSWKIVSSTYAPGNCMSISYAFVNAYGYNIGPVHTLNLTGPVMYSGLSPILPLPIPPGTLSISILTESNCNCTFGIGRSTALPHVIGGRSSIASAGGRCSNSRTWHTETFTAVPLVPSPTIAYQWYKSSGGATFSAIPAATDSTYTYSPSDSDKLYFVATDTLTTDTSDTFTIHIYSYPTLVNAFDSITICPDDSAKLKVLSPSGSNQYFWTGAVTGLNANNTEVMVHPLTSTSYTVSAVNEGGCSTQHTVKVNVLPFEMLDITVSQTDICAGQGVHLYINDPVATTTYSWSGGGINCIGARCDTAVDSPRVTTTYTVTATDISGCSRSTTITVNVHSPHVTMTPDRNEVCGDGTVTLSVDNPDPDAIYTWSGDYTSCSNAECTVVTASVSATTTYSVTMTDMFGCVGVAKHFIDWYELPVIDATVSANNICAGTTITLSASSTSPGYHFVWWDGSSTCTCVSPLCDEITATPVSNTVYQVTAFNPSGCSATAYVFVNMAIPVQAEVDNNMVCPGSTVNLSVADPLPGITYTWSGGSVTCDDGDCYKAHDNPTDITIYTLTATSGDGCSAISTVEVDMFKPMRIDIKQSDDKICLGTKVELGAYIEKGDKYTWSGGEFSCESPECDEILVKPEATTTYTVTAIDENGCIETGTVTINMAIPININVASTTVCPGQSVEMSIDNPDPHYQYHWDGGSVECEGEVCEDAHDLLWKTTTYTVTATDEKCSSATTITINVDYFEITPVVDNERVCPGSLVTLSIENPDPTYTYSWSGGNVACTSPDCNMATDNPVSNTAYVLTAVDGFGCTAINSVEVNMNVPLAVVPSASSICAGQSAVAYIDNPSESISYWWSASSGTFTCLDAQCGAISVQPEATTEYTVTATDANGCTNTSSFVIEVVPLPAVNAIADNATVCSGGTINLSVLSPDPTCTYSWSGDGISCADPSCYAANGNVSNSSTFTVTATNGNGCSSSTAVEVNVYPNAIDVTASQLTICPGNSDTISVIGNGGPYTWYGSGITCLNMLCDSIVVNPFDSAVYYVVVTDSNGCIDTAGVYIDISDSCQTDSFYAKHAQGVNAVEEHFIIAPNPNDGVLTVRGSLAGKQDDELITITVYDISGRLMMSSDAQSYNGIVKQSIQLPDNAANGTYMIKIRTAVSEHVMKFTLNR